MMRPRRPLMIAVPKPKPKPKTMAAKKRFTEGSMPFSFVELSVYLGRLKRLLAVLVEGIDVSEL